MTIKVKTLIIDSYKRTGRLAERMADLDASRLAIGLQELNDIIQRYNVEEYFPFTIKKSELNVSQLKFDWTVGTSASDFNIDRPIKISSLYFKPSQNAIAINLLQVSVNDIDLYKVGSQASGMPRYFAYDAGYPEATIMFNVQPQVGSVLIATYNESLPELEIDDDLTIPLEYNDLLKWSLAYNIAVRSGMEQTDTMFFMKERDRALNSIKSKNSALKKRTWNERMYGTTNNILNLGTI